MLKPIHSLSGEGLATLPLSRPACRRLCMASSIVNHLSSIHTYVLECTLNTHRTSKYWYAY